MIPEDDLAAAAARFRTTASEIGRRKSLSPQGEIEAEIDAAFDLFCTTTNNPLRVTVRFADVFALMGVRAHVQLAAVSLRGEACALVFHESLLRADDGHGLVFVAKAWTLLAVIARMAEDGPLPDADFVFEIGDNGFLDSVSFCSNNPSACLIIDDEFAGSLGYRTFRTWCAAHPLSWAERRNQLVWRGSTTGIPTHAPPKDAAADDLSWLARLQAARLAQAPDLAAFCDVGVTSIVQISDPVLVGRVQASGLLRAPLPRETMRLYRYILDIDGNSNAWSGLFCALLGGGCVLKVGSRGGFRQWYYHELRPMEAFVPIAADLGDFTSVVRRLMQGEGPFEEIAEAGRRLAERITFERALEASAQSLASWLARRAAASAATPSFLSWRPA